MDLLKSLPIRELTWLPFDFQITSSLSILCSISPNWKKTPNTIPNHIQPPPPLVIIDNELEDEIVEILDSKIGNHHQCKLLYFVQPTDEETSWLPATELDHTQELITDFHTHYPEKPRPLST
ncbi:hypothetical protein L208DRAFT_1541786 [Tricholoma matsutake]|nr:hypothetical protein L208DRAFT_1541786 [Tricholoma matsutake 945]